MYNRLSNLFILCRVSLILLCCLIILLSFYLLFKPDILINNKLINFSHKIHPQTKTYHNVNNLKFDEFDRLCFYPQKIPVDCPPQTEKTKVLLLIGQSNAGNHAGQRYTSQYGSRVLNLYDSKCFIAESPLLGSTGFGGESWTLLGNKLIKNNLADRVILIPAAIAGSKLESWQKGKVLNRMLLEVIAEATSMYRITDVLWHQGEADFRAGTTKEQYIFMLRSLVESLRDHNLDAPLYVSIASKCWLNDLSGGWKENNPVSLAQSMLDDSSLKIYRGVNTDRLMNRIDRYDDCHFSATGQEKFTEEWVSILRVRANRKF